MKFIDLLNEEIDIDKERNRVKTVHKALIKGVVNVSGTRFRYELPEEYTFHVVDDVITQTSIKFTFYNKDISEGGDGLPLKIWRIEEGKDVYLNKMLTGQDVGDISYNDEYNINTKSGVEYVSAKNKVRNKYRNFDINAIMTTPSDLINESEDKYEQRKQKMIKRGKTIFKALRKGVISDDQPDGLRFSYELSNDISVHINNLGIVIFTDGVKIKELNRACDRYSPAYMMSRIRNKFDQFDVTIESPYLTSDDVERWEEPKEPINEEKDNNLTDKDRKKIELIYGLFKTGKYKVDDLIYTYVLPDEYWTSKDKETGDLLIILTMNPQQRMKLYATLDNGVPSKGHETEVEREYHHLHNQAKEKIKQKFERFNIEIIF